MVPGRPVMEHSNKLHGTAQGNHLTTDSRGRGQIGPSAGPGRPAEDAAARRRARAAGRPGKTQRPRETPAEQNAGRGVLNISDVNGETVGTGFYGSDGQVTLILDRRPEHRGRIMVYDRTPDHPGSKNISKNLNLRDAAEGPERLQYLGKLRPTKGGRGWWGELEAEPKGKSKEGHPRFYACRPPSSEPQR